MISIDSDGCSLVLNDFQRCSLISNPQAKAAQRDVATRRAMESEELLVATNAIEESKEQDGDDTAEASGGQRTGRPGGTWSLEKTKLEAEIDFKRLKQKAIDLKEYLTKEFTATVERLRKSQHGEIPDGQQHLQGSALEALNGLTEKKKDAIAQVACILDAVQPALDAVSQASSKQALTTLMTQLKECTVSMRKGKVKDFLTLLNITKRYLLKQESKLRRGASTEAPPSASPGGPLWVIMHAFLDRNVEGLNVCQSVNAAKAGYCICIQAPKNGEEDIVLRLNSNGCVKKLKRELFLQVKKTGTCSAVIHFNDNMYKAVERMLKRAFESQTRTITMLPQQPWANKIFQPEIYHTADKDVNIFTTNNGMCEARLYLSGGEDVVGLHYDDIPGDNFHAKRHAVSAMTIDQLGSIVKEKHGFATRCAAKDEKLVIIPSGRIVINASDGATYLRWGIYCDESDLGRVQLMLRSVLQAFPEYRCSMYPVLPFCEFLESRG